jgi:hypothetical protein
MERESGPDSWAKKSRPLPIIGAEARGAYPACTFDLASRSSRCHPLTIDRPFGHLQPFSNGYRRFPEPDRREKLGTSTAWRRGRLHLRQKTAKTAEDRENRA